MNDHIVRAMTRDGFVKVAAISSKGIVERARQIHKCLPMATAALGRTLSACSLMGNMQKVENGSVTLQIKGGGPWAPFWRSLTAWATCAAMSPILRFL